MPEAAVVREIARLVRRERLDYEGFRRVCARVRKEAGLRRPPRSRRLPALLSDSDLRKFYEAIDRAGNLQHQIMLRLLFFTAIRVAELTNIRVEHVNLEACKIFIEQGKGAKDRYILFPESFRLTLKTYLAVNPKNRYLFESRNRTHYSTRRVQQLVSEYAEVAGLSVHVHPHLFRHQMLTWLTAQGLPDSQIQLVSGHASKQSLEVYQHLALKDANPAYQKAVKDLGL